MKKTLTVFFLVALFSLIMTIGVFAAEPIVLNEENPVLDLTGKNIEGPIVVESGNVTIKGNGTVTSPVYTSDYTGTEISADYCTILVRGGNLTIEGGTFISNTGWNKATHAALYVMENGKVTVNDGTFKGQGKDFAVKSCGEITTVEGGATITINGGTFDSQRVTGVAECGGTININGGTWTCQAKYNGQSDTLNIYTIVSNKLGKMVIKGGTFVDFNPTAIYTEGPFPAQEELEPTNAVAEGYVFDEETGTVACPHTDLEEHKEVAATYEKEGSKAYWSCNTCGKWFEDKEATKEITDKDSIVIAKLVKVEEDDKEEEKPAEEDKKEEAKDEEPKMGVEISTISVLSVVVLIALAGYVVSKKK